MRRVSHVRGKLQRRNHSQLDVAFHSVQSGSFPKDEPIDFKLQWIFSKVILLVNASLKSIHFSTTLSLSKRDDFLKNSEGGGGVGEPFAMFIVYLKIKGLF